MSINNNNNGGIMEMSSKCNCHHHGCPQPSFPEGCGCYKGLEYFHKLEKESQFLFNESGEYVDKTVYLLNKAGNALGESGELLALAEEKSTEAQNWLAENGQCYWCNATDPECVALQAQINTLVQQISEEQTVAQEGLFLFIQSLTQIQNDYQQLANLQAQYNQCVHEGMNGCHRPCQCRGRN